MISRIQTGDLTTIENAHHKETKFLVSASTDKEMAPVWLDYQSFYSATAFLDTMASECLLDWDPSAQLNSEIMGLSSQVVAASVKFEWMDFHIRVRAGRDQDWNSVLKKLEKAWLDKDHGLENPEEFRIGVMLHVSG